MTITLGHRRAAHGGAERHRPPPAGGRDAWLGLGDLLRQDRHAHPQRDDGAHGDDERTRRFEVSGVGYRPEGELRGRGRPSRRSCRRSDADRSGQSRDPLQRRRACARPVAPGSCRAIRWRARFVSLGVKAGHDAGAAYASNFRAPTRFPSIPSINSWRRCITAMRTALPSPMSRARRSGILAMCSAPAGLIRRRALLIEEFWRSRDR